jgi:N-acetylglutamate synthase-like GNAT family acetyltransferase
MRQDHKLALEICRQKKERITEQDLQTVFITTQSRQNTLKYFRTRGWIIFDTDLWGFKINPAKTAEIEAELMS